MLLCAGISYLLPDPPAVPAPDKRPPGTAVSHDWIIIFRSSDPNLWDQRVSAGDDLAVPVATVPENITYLRIRHQKEFVIVPMTKARLSWSSTEGRYGWEGANHFTSTAYHLGIVDEKAIPPNKGDVVVSAKGTCRGWGFGHRHMLPDEQGYGWNGAALPPTIFEIAVKPGKLTDAEMARLLR
jgi:hypothetical protein